MIFVKYYLIVATMHHAISNRLISRDRGTRYKQGKEKATLEQIAIRRVVICDLILIAIVSFF